MTAPRDWATEDAERLVRLIGCAADTGTLVDLLAVKLRLVKFQGHCEGLAAAQAALDEVFKKRAAQSGAAS